MIVNLTTMREPGDPIGEKILDATVEVALVHGLTRLSVADVAKRAGISRPTL
jgi:AcrR family transcriptional regulator